MELAGGLSATHFSRHQWTPGTDERWRCPKRAAEYPWSCSDEPQSRRDGTKLALWPEGHESRRGEPRPELRGAMASRYRGGSSIHFRHRLERMGGRPLYRMEQIQRY